MLLQEGLVDIIPLSLSEQVAYLLADRASLLEKIPNQEDVKTADDPDVYKEDCGGKVVKVRESVLRLSYYMSNQMYLFSSFNNTHCFKKLYRQSLC